jgi:hypothetical protein
MHLFGTRKSLITNDTSLKILVLSDIKLFREQTEKPAMDFFLKIQLRSSRNNFMLMLDDLSYSVL